MQIEKTNFIPKKDAMILWNSGVEKPKLYVLRFTSEERKTSRELENTVLERRANQKRGIIRLFSSTDGNCFPDWDETHIGYSLILKFINYPDLNKKNVLFEFGKIEECEWVRRAIFELYPDWYANMTFEEFEYYAYRGFEEQFEQEESK